MMNCEYQLPGIRRADLDALAGIGMLDPQQEYYLLDERRVAIADDVQTYHLLSADGAGMQTARAVPGTWLPGQCRQFTASGTTSPNIGRLFAIPFASIMTLAALGVAVTTAGSTDSVAMAGIYGSRQRDGLPDGELLIEDLGEISMATAGDRPFPLLAERFIDYPWWAAIIFGGTMPPAVASHLTVSEESARVWGSGSPGSPAGPNTPVSGLYLDMAYPAAMPGVFPTGAAPINVAVGLAAKGA